MSARLGAALLLAVPAWLAAQSFADPTQPPAELLAPSSGEAAPAAPAAPQLQSVLISHNQGGRKVAVINGEMVRIGERVGDARVVDMTPTDVTLRRGKVIVKLKLFPEASVTRTHGQ